MSNSSRSPEIKPASKQPSPTFSSRTMGNTNNSKIIKENITHLKNQVLEMEPSNVKTSTNNSNSHISYTISIPYPFVNNSESVKTNMSKSQKNINIIIKIPQNNSKLEKPIIKISNILPNSILESITFKPNNFTQKIEVTFDGKMSSSIKNTLTKMKDSFMYTGRIEKNQEYDYYMFLFASITFMIQHISRMYKNKQQYFNIPNTHQSAVRNNLAFLLDIYYGRYRVENIATIFDFKFTRLSQFDETTLKKLFIRATRDIKNYYTSQKTHTSFSNKATTKNVSTFDYSLSHFVQNTKNNFIDIFFKKISNIRDNLAEIQTEIQKTISSYSSQIMNEINQLFKDIQDFIKSIYELIENGNSIDKESFLKYKHKIKNERFQNEIMQKITQLNDLVRNKKLEIQKRLTNRTPNTKHMLNEKLVEPIVRDISDIRYDIQKLHEKIERLKK